MRLKWYGHASFLVTGSNGTTIVTDPYTPETSGYSPVEDKPDIVIISSANDSFHCRADLIPGNPVVLNALDVAESGGPRIEKGICVQAIKAMEALDHRYHDPDQNGMYRFEVDGMHIGHMGDVGNPFSRQQLDFFRGLDVFLVLAGDHPTIRLNDLMTAIEQIHPRLVIPMHFRTLTYKPKNSYWIQSFLDYFIPADVDFALHYEVEFMPQDLPQKTRVLVMDYVHQPRGVAHYTQPIG